MLPRPIGDRVQPPPRAPEPCRRPVHRRVRVLQQLLVLVELVADLDRKVVLSVDAV